MPTYDYDCIACGGFEALRSIAARNDAVDCPHCGIASQRVLAGAARLAVMEATTRRAMDINERARHEPKRSAALVQGHPSGCSCCASGKGGKRNSSVTSPGGNKAFPTRRPWMISH